jgi:hypothetical protein
MAISAFGTPLDLTVPDSHSATAPVSALDVGSLEGRASLHSKTCVMLECCSSMVEDADSFDRGVVNWSKARLSGPFFNDCMIKHVWKLLHKQSTIDHTIQGRFDLARP